MRKKNLGQNGAALAALLFAAALCGISCDLPEIPVVVKARPGTAFNTEAEAGPETALNPDAGAGPGTALNPDAGTGSETGTGVLTLLLPKRRAAGSPGASRSVLSDDFIDTLAYEVTFTFGDTVIERRVEGEGISLALPAGDWDIEAEAYDGLTLVGTGEAAATVIQGRNTSVTIPMYVDQNYEAGLTAIYIHNEAELRRIGTEFAIDNTMHFYLEDDIVLSQPWTPIGNSVTRFEAAFDGNGHTIAINSDSNGNSFSSAALNGGYLGFFGATYEATIENLTIVYNDDLTVNSSSTATRWMGGLAASATDTLINNVHVKGTISYTASGALYIGGLVGSAGGTSTAISTSSFTGTLDGTGAQEVSVGGILGVLNGNSNNARIEESYAAGTIHADSQSIGDAFAGGITGSGDCFIENCYSAAAVGAFASGDAYAGGIIGELPVAVAGFGKCYALGPVSADGSGIYAGGIAGRSGSPIDNCVALAEVDGSTTGTTVGRVIGNFWDPPYSATNYAASDKAINRAATYSSTAVDGTTNPINTFEGSGNQAIYTGLSWTFGTPGSGWMWLPPYPYPVLHWQDEAPDATLDNLGGGFTWP